MSKNQKLFGIKTKHKTNGIIVSATIWRDTYQNVLLTIVIKDKLGSAVHYFNPTLDNLTQLFDAFNVDMLCCLANKTVTAYWDGPCGAVTLLGFKPRKAGKKDKNRKD